jgi:dTDP-4-dehydrorhamnose 3,5-epimerase
LNIIRTDIPDVLLLEPKVFNDSRGSFFETYNRRAFKEATGIDPEFVQDNQSHSLRNVLRGLHYQIKQPQGKLVRVVAGEIWDVAVDIRRSSPTFGKWVGFPLSAQTKRTAWIPVGFAHGFLVTSEVAEVQYKVTDYYAPEHERTLLWSDPDLAILWPIRGVDLVVAEKDRRGTQLRMAAVYG